jgi:hypothetical protein|tara:strand:+ start:945 stop:1079 length:135 start_codon:yes stop_codon:yes gene_type:complete
LKSGVVAVLVAVLAVANRVCLVDLVHTLERLSLIHKSKVDGASS